MPLNIKRTPVARIYRRVRHKRRMCVSGPVIISSCRSNISHTQQNAYVSLPKDVSHVSAAQQN